MERISVQGSGDSLRIELPIEFVRAFGLKPGDELFFNGSEAGAWLSPYDPELFRALKAAQEGMRRYKNTLRELGE